MDDEPQADVSEELLAELRGLILTGHTVSAIKRYREAKGCGLKEAKDWIDGCIDCLFPGKR